MCGRYALELSADQLAQSFGVAVKSNMRPRYNIAPSQQVCVVHANELKSARWGWTIANHYTKHHTVPQINARAETITQKPSFRTHIAQGRCLLPASAFYEWQYQGQHKGQPYAVRPAAGEANLFAFAGLWRKYQDVSECVIITIAANKKLASIHPREPVMIPQKHFQDWQHLPPRQAVLLLQTSLEAQVEIYPINHAVNHVSCDGPELLEPAVIENVEQMNLL